MSEQDNIQVVKDLYAAFGGGDFAVMLDFWVDDLVYYVPGPPDILPWAGTLRGKAELRQWYEMVAKTLEFDFFEPQQYLVNGETVVVLGTQRYRVKNTDKVIDNDFAYVYTVRDGKIVKCHEHNDSAAQVAVMQRA